MGLAWAYRNISFPDAVTGFVRNATLQFIPHPFREGILLFLGLTGLLLLAESHLACHTFPEHGSICLNLFCCKPRPDWDFAGELATRLGARAVGWRVVVGRETLELRSADSDLFDAEGSVPALCREPPEGRFTEGKVSGDVLDLMDSKNGGTQVFSGKVPDIWLPAGNLKPEMKSATFAYFHGLSVEPGTTGWLVRADSTTFTSPKTVSSPSSPMKTSVFASRKATALTCPM